MDTDTKPQGEDQKPFLYAEECGLALFKHRSSGKKLCMDKPLWTDLKDGLKAGWTPRG